MSQLYKGPAIKKYLLEHVSKHPADIVLLTMKHFQVTRTTVIRHINQLINTGKLFKSGSTSDTRYFLQSSYDRYKSYMLNKSFAEDKIFNDFADIFSHFPKNIFDICFFGVTEMLNNAIDHSNGNKIFLETKFQAPNLTITVQDNGLGAFKTICDFLRIPDLREGIIHISKGKITRDPTNHTGQGIFFTSRMFDKFIIEANDLVYEKNNSINDWSFRTLYGAKGTKIIMEINVHSSTTCKQVFFAFEGSEHAFDKTEIMVDLADFKESSFISRSQAKRILLGLEKFLLITFNFMKIDSVGQGFVDEIFRVFANKHPDIKLQYVNANESVRFMIERGLRA